MDGKFFTSGDLVSLYRWTGVRQAIISAERVGSIPKAERGGRRSASARVWTYESLPAIGERFGFLDKQKLKGTLLMATYSGKGGVGKTTLTYNLGRLFALHNFKTLIVGLDVQGSLTELALNPTANLNSIEEFSEYGCVMDAIEGNLGCIQTTPLPTLHVLPENGLLAEATIRLAAKSMRHTVFHEKIVSKLKKIYDVVIFDNSPAWSSLVENSIAASDFVLMPASASIGCYQVLDNNMNQLLDFLEKTGKRIKRIFLIPTLVEPNKLSKQVHAAYTSQYSDYVTTASIRRTVKGAEAFALAVTPLEHQPASELSDDYVALIKELYAEAVK